MISYIYMICIIFCKNVACDYERALTLTSQDPPKPKSKAKAKGLPAPPNAVGPVRTEATE